MAHTILKWVIYVKKPDACKEDTCWGVASYDAAASLNLWLGYVDCPYEREILTIEEYNALPDWPNGRP